MLEVKHLTVRSKEGRPLVRDCFLYPSHPGEPLGLTGARRIGQDYNHQGSHGDSALWLCY